MVDTVIVNSTTPTEDPAHAQAMIDKIDAANAVPSTESETPLSDPPPEDRPQWLPEKFKSPEELAKAYAELQSKLGGKATDNPADEPKDNTAEGDKTPEVLAGYDPSQHVKNEADAEWELNTYGPALKDIFDKAGIKASVISAEFHSTGNFPEYAYEKLQAAGFSRGVVDGYLGGQQQKATYQSEQATAEIKQTIGGEQSFNEMVEWASVNLTPGELQAYNKAVDSGDKNLAILAVQGIHSKFTAARPAEPSLYKGATSSAQSSEAYESIAQMQKDMANPEYKNDPAFRAKVERKLSRSNIL